MVATFSVPGSSAIYVGKFQPVSAPQTLIVFNPQTVAGPQADFGVLSLVTSPEPAFEEEATWEDACWQ